jgi:hypothetical protein
MGKENFGDNGIMRVHKPSKNWGIVDRNMMADQRISIAARGVLGWLATRHDDHRLLVSNLKRECLLGQSKWQRLRGELEKFGYFKAARKIINRRFVWEFDVYPFFDGVYDPVVLSTSKPNTFKTHGYNDTEGSETEGSDTKPSHPPAAPAAQPLKGFEPKKHKKATPDRAGIDSSPSNPSGEVLI